MTTAALDPIPSRIPNGGSEVIVPTRKTVANPLIQGTKRTLSQRDDSASLDDHLGPDVKWKASGSTLSAVEREREALSAEEERSLLKKARREAEDEEREDDGLYHGATSYKSHIKKREDGVPKAMRVGPQKSTSTIRTVTVIDYQPDVCKDYKETGYCGFGDTCKFLHDRGTYLQGWQLDKIAADPKKKATAEESDTDEEDIPWACYICRKPYTDPVVTRCQHYFCSACAIKRFAKTPKCAACSAPTGGIFNRADKVVEKMRAAVRAKEEKEMRGEGDEDAPGRSRDLELELDLPER
ncbi:hypothetical protein BS47DRAFT_1335072 [Hydnum rufescens UP504]|uniref:Pre-mRNA-splicing factor CWC24 n=1 Tax=Hydnum rufescens UP504 TaxID=1448309 RepID=A0A9P6BBE9_9AGAM|nr:hypothetical protein BS47DRAFT_1335072 [Hydnum rufescens UP504]